MVLAQINNPTPYGIERRRGRHAAGHGVVAMPLMLDVRRDQRDANRRATLARLAAL